MIKRAEVYFTGRVQGVGFRYTAADLARKFNVLGYVKNLPDERVELVVEGEEFEIKKFVDAVCNSMVQYIEKYSITWADANNQFTSFQIRY